MDGTWQLAIDSPIGQQPAVVELKTDNGAVTGSMKNSLTGVVTDINEGTVVGNKIDFAVSVTQPFPLSMKVSATYEGNSMSGEATLQPYGTFKLTGERSDGPDA
ncbi:hypothetical protein QQG74_13675 [Micromonospora sp. FIMYZ51]|uniref:hypothetical protein n=1 Tax=Micromonospora sp. FIMYZ51 TaxID=3051832 RepID=UPI00311E8905